jgi:hypothetical protein
MALDELVSIIGVWVFSVLWRIILGDSPDCGFTDCQRFADEVNGDPAGRGDETDAAGAIELLSRGVEDVVAVDDDEEVLVELLGTIDGVGDGG